MRYKFFPLLLIVSLSMIGILGAFWLSTMDHTGRVSCPFSAMSGGSCPSAQNTFSLAIHHLSGLQLVLQFIISEHNTLFAFVVLFLISVFFISKLISSQIFFIKSRAHLAVYVIEAFYCRARREFIRWLTLCYRRYPRVSQGAYDIS